ncbi:MAG: PEP-CTERM sorting domain-containing protein [Verrucomicrobiota bacterium]
MKTLRILVLFSVFSVIATLHTGAAPLYFTSTNGLADLSGSPLDVTYNSTSGSFQVKGDLQDFIDSSGTDTGDYSGYGGYVISATINNAGVLASGGSVTIIDSASDTLLAGSLKSGASGTAWGYYNNSSIDQFTFLFTVTGGTVASDFGGIGGLCGISLFADFSGNSTGTGHDTPFTGTWGGSFNNLRSSGANTGNGTADIFPVPEPSSFLLVSAGFLCMITLRRRNASRV